MRTNYDYPTSARQGLRRWVTHPLIWGLAMFYGAILLGLWGGQFL